MLPKSFCFTLTCSLANISYSSRDIRYNSSAARISLTQACDMAVSDDAMPGTEGLLLPFPHVRSRGNSGDCVKSITW